MTTHANKLSSLAIIIAALATITLTANEASAKSGVVRSINVLRAPLTAGKVRPVSAPVIQRRNFQIQMGTSDLTSRMRRR
jgi:hypothetical protein